MNLENKTGDRFFNAVRTPWLKPDRRFDNCLRRILVHNNVDRHGAEASAKAAIHVSHEAVSRAV